MKYFILLLSIWSTSLYAGNTATGNIILSGAVAAATNIAVTGVVPYSALDLSVTQTNLLVANVTEVNNTTNGYTVTLTSANAGTLKNGTFGSIIYTAQYNGVSANLSTTPVNITTGAASNTVVNAIKTLKISYTGVPAASVMVGTYSDTLTFTIVGN